MLRKSDTPPSDVLPHLTRRGLEATFLVPTPTGLDKSILDATESVREFLRAKGYHDFEQQGQAQKILRSAFFIHPDRLEETKVSLYRPQSKEGDPRIWFYGLPRYAKPFNLLAILCEEGKLYVVNASSAETLGSLDRPESPLGTLGRLHDALEPVAAELLALLKGVGQRGFIASMRQGDTGVGYTLESLLGIAANTSQAPDYKGIEIKAARRSGGPARENRVNLFSQVPAWSRSKLRSGAEILRGYGYKRAGRLQLYCTVGPTPNPQGLYFDVSSGELVWHRAMIASQTHDVVCWETSNLVRRLLEKHPSTMWVKAKCRGERRTSEEFHYTEAIYTRNPIASSLLPLIDDGTITMDYTLSMRESGAARDHGYLFKIRPEDLPALFPPPKSFDLTS